MEDRMIHPEDVENMSPLEPAEQAEPGPEPEEYEVYADDFPQPTDEDLRRWEREREERREAYLAPFRAATAQRKESARLTAEHDNDLAELLFEITMMKLEEV